MTRAARLTLGPTISPRISRTLGEKCSGKTRNDTSCTLSTIGQGERGGAEYVMCSRLAPSRLARIGYNNGMRTGEGTRGKGVTDTQACDRSEPGIASGRGV